MLSGIAVIVVTLLTSSSSSRADYENPNTDTTFIPTDFTSSYMHYRANRTGLGTGLNAEDEKYFLADQYYEGFAAGKSRSPGSPAKNGNIYYFQSDRGYTWTLLKRMEDAVTAIGGRYEYDWGHNRVWFGTDKGGIYYMSTAGRYNNTTAPPAFVTSSVPDQGQFAIRSIAASNATDTQIMAGGDKGTIMRHKAFGAADEWEALTDTTETGDFLVTGRSNNKEIISGISYLKNSNVAYVTTTEQNDGRFDDEATDFSTGCDGNGRLYRVVGHSWKLLKEYNDSVNLCFYGVTAYPTNSVMNNVDVGGGTSMTLTTAKVWVATSDGIYSYLDNNTTKIWTQISDTDNQAFFAIDHALVSPGPNTNLILNPTLEAEDNPAVPRTPQFWTTRLGGRREKDKNCSIENDFSTSGLSGTDHRFIITPQESDEECRTLPGPVSGLNHKEEIVQRIDLSALEGSRFRLTAKYRVEANGPTGQGGIAVGCVGAESNDSEIDCSLRNTAGIYVVDADHRGHPSDSDQIFSMDFSRQDLLLAGNPKKTSQKAIMGGTTYTRPVSTALYLEVRCEATIGAIVYCGDFSLTPLASPDMNTLASPDPNVEVYAVGNNFTTGSIPHALDAAPSIVYESNPAVTSTHNNLRTVAAAGSQHVVVAGDQNNMFMRLPGTLQGFAWVGTPVTVARSSVGDPTEGGGLGNISTSCLNTSGVAGNLFCDDAQESYSMTLTNTALIGRAWFGKQYQTGREEKDNHEDYESLSLGSCLGAFRRPHPITPSNPPLCNLNSNTCADNTNQACETDAICDPDWSYKISNTCDESTRTCYVPAGYTGAKKACERDFDCYGHCSLDQGFLCATDADCRAPGLSTQTTNESKFLESPSDYLECLNGDISSVSACGAIGWLSFDPRDFSGLSDDTTVPNSVPAVGVGVTYENSTGHLSGYARFMSLANPNNTNRLLNSKKGRGWMSFRGGASPPVTVGTNEIYGCQNCSGTTLGNVSCGYCRDRDGRSCNAQPNNCYNVCKSAIGTRCWTKAQCGGTDPCVVPGRCSVDLNKVCLTSADCLPLGGTCGSYGSICKGLGVNSCSAYGVDFDQVTHQFTGFAWSSDFGWVDWSKVSVGSSRYIQTRLGDIYAKKQIGGEDTKLPPGNASNGTYLILSEESVTGFKSAYSNDISYCENAVCSAIPKALPFAGSKNVFTNLLGRADIVGMETPTESTSGISKNKYGSQIITVDIEGPDNSITSTNPSDPNSLYNQTDTSTEPLNNRVFVVGTPSNLNTTFTIDQELKFFNGDTDGSTTTFGHGVLIVNGNLYIANNMSYEKSSISDLRQLASLTVIVKGNLIVDTGVTSIVGAYFVTVPSNGPATFCSTRKDGDSPCNPGTTVLNNPNNYQLSVSGLIIAQAFDFSRKKTGSVSDPRPSELIIQDGRFQANPSPGLQDFANALPITAGSGP